MSDPKFKELINSLELTEDNRLMLGTVPMILMPRWFFVGIMNRVVERAGRETAAGIYYDAGYQGAYDWGKVQLEAGLTGRAVMEQYLGSMTSRGWGRFEIVAMDIPAGRGTFRVHDSALALELGAAGAEACLWHPGAMAGCFQVILDHQGIDLKVRGRETSCLAHGAACCESVVEPD